MLIFAPLCPAHCEEVFREDFEETANGTELRQRVERVPNVSIVPDRRRPTGRELEVVYQANERGSEGISTSVRLDAAAEHLALNYELEFDKDFLFARGGKLPGLGPEKPVTGGKKVTESGWSVRPMWRENGLLTSYTYHQDQPGKTGDYRRSDGFCFGAGKRYLVTVEVRLNSTAGESDGFARILVDGVEQVRHDDLRFYSGTDTGGRIARLLFSTFHGGRDKSWTPKASDGRPKDVIARFDDIVVGPPSG